MSHDIHSRKVIPDVPFVGGVDENDVDAFPVVTTERVRVVQLGDNLHVVFLAQRRRDARTGDLVVVHHDDLVTLWRQLGRGWTSFVSSTSSSFC